MTQPATGAAERRFRFDRNELAGAFGDVGTDLPLIVGMVLAARLDSASVLIAFGLMQVFTGVVYRMPMPVQPLKAIAALVITQHIASDILYGAGLAIGIVMAVLSALGLLNWLARIVPKPVVRGIQVGLGLQLSSLALRDYVRADQLTGYVLAAIAFAIIVALLGNRKVPAALPVIALGIAYAFVFKLQWSDVTSSFGLRLPQLHVPQLADVLTGFVVLALPQIPLSLGNTILATQQVVRDCFPGTELSVRRIGFTYSAMNLVNPLLSGIPTCHGSGGFAGHYAFGARTGASVVIYGMLYLVLGLFFSGGFATLVGVFPLPMLGVLLLFEGLALMLLVRDLAPLRGDFAVSLLVALSAAFLPYGYVIGLVVGTVLIYLTARRLTGLQ